MAEDKALIVSDWDEVNGELASFNGYMVDYASGEGVDEILGYIRQAAILVPDLSTGKSRQEIASMSGKVSSSKVLLESAGKDLVGHEKSLIADRLKRIDAINATRTKIKTTLDALRDEVRAPLTQWEKDKAAEKARIALEIKIEDDHTQALIDNEVFDQRQELARQSAELKRQQEELAIQQKAQKIAQEMVIEAARKAPEPSVKAAVEYAETLKWETEPEAPADPPALDKDDQVLNDILDDLRAVGLMRIQAAEVVDAIEKGAIRHLIIDRGDEW